jgi:tetratricopeptide (TPR) repeat protein/O-antigen ligase
VVLLSLPGRVSFTERIFKDYIQWVSRIGIVLVLAWLTFDFGGHHYRPEGLLRFTTLIFACFWLLIPFRRFPPLTYLGWPLVIFLLSSFISTFFSAYFHDSFLEWTTLVCLVLIFIMVYDLWSTPSLHYGFIHYVLMVGFIACCVGIYFKVAYVSGDMQSLMGQGGIHSTFYQADVFGGFLILLFPLAFLLFLEEREHSRLVLYGLLSSYYGLCIVLTYSRGAWISIFFAFLALGILIMTKKVTLPSFKVLFLKSLAVGIAVILFFVFFNNATKTLGKQSITDRLKVRATEIFAEGDSARSARLQFWIAALKISAHHPVFGTGLKTFGRFYPAYEDDIRHFSKYTHNLYLQFASELGWLPTTFFILVVALLFWHHYRLLPYVVENRFLYVSHLGILIGAVAAFCHHFVDVDWFFPALPGLWLALTASSMGCIIKHHVPGGLEQSEREPGDKELKDFLLPGLSRHMAGQFGFCMLFMFLSLLIALPFFSMRLSEAAEMMRKTGHVNEAIENYERALKLDPFNSEFQRALSDLYFTKAVTGKDSQENYRKAENHIREAIRIDPARSVLHHFMGKILWQRGANEQALPYFEKALELDGKNFPGFYNDIANYYLSKDNFQKAEEYYMRADRIFISEALSTFWIFRAGPTKLQLAETYLGLGNINIKKKNYGDAEKYMKKSLEFQEGNYLAIFSIGYINYQRGDYPAALLYMEWCIGREPRFALAHLFESFALNNLGSAGESEKSMKRAYELDPGLKGKEIEQPGKK